MKNVIIVGAGGLAKDVYSYLHLNNEINIKGFLVDYVNDYKSLNIKSTYLGKIKEYNIEPKDNFIIAIGENPGRKNIFEYFKSKNANFYNYIHPSTVVNYDLKLGKGILIGPFCVLGSSVIIENNVFINKFSNVGHDCQIGNHSILYPYSMIGGKTKIGNNVILSTRSTISPKLNISDNCIIYAHSFVKDNLEKNTKFYQEKKDIKKQKNND